jgi:hypothetical protein
MSAIYPYAGIYDRWGYTRRNGLLEAPAVNPLPPNRMSNNTGDAGRDGYTVLSRADRNFGERQISRAEPFYEAPKNSEDMS